MCSSDLRALNRVYIPQDAFAAAGIGPESLDAAKASPALLSVISGLARRTWELLTVSRAFAGQIRDRRLAFEVSVIQIFAEDLDKKLMQRDPLSERVHHGKSDALRLLVPAFIRFLKRRAAA